MGVSCAKCKSADLRKLKRNSFLQDPGYICKSCGLKMRGLGIKGTLYAYIVMGTLFAVVGTVFSGGILLLLGLLAAAYGVTKLRQPEPTVTGEDLAKEAGAGKAGVT